MTLSIKQRDPRKNKNSTGYMRQQMSFWNDLLPDLSRIRKKKNLKYFFKKINDDKRFIYY